MNRGTASNLIGYRRLSEISSSGRPLWLTLGWRYLNQLRAVDLVIARIMSLFLWRPDHRVSLLSMVYFSDPDSPWFMF